MVHRDTGSAGASGLVVACYGTADAGARERFVAPVVEACARAYREAEGPEAPVAVAFTSARARAALAERGEIVADPASALEHLWEAGVRRVTVASSHLVDGAAYHGLAEAVRAKAPLFDEVRLASPLLSSAADVRSLARAIDAHLPRAQGRAVVLVGHGAAGAGGLAYLALGRALADNGRDDVICGVLRGDPGADAVDAALAARAGAVREVLLAPLMLSVAGHAWRDVMGEGPTSWCTRLRAQGRAVTVAPEGLGAWPEVCALAAAHLAAAPAVGVHRAGNRRATAAGSPHFPLFVDLNGTRCLVVGCGAVGGRRARALARFGAQVLVVDPAASVEVAPGIEVARRRYEPGDEAGCTLVVAATDDRAANRMIAERCRRQGIIVSVADAPEECTFFFPALCEGERVVAGVASRAADARGHALVAQAAAQIRRVIP